MRFTVRRLMIAVVGLALVLGSVTWGLRKAENRLVVENRSGQRLAWLQITMSNSALVVNIKGSPDGGAEPATFWIRGDDSFAVNGSLPDGTRVTGGFEHVTNGDYGERPRIVIHEGGGVKFNQ